MIVPIIPVVLEPANPLETADADGLISLARKCNLEILLDDCKGTANDNRIAMRLAGFRWEKVPDSPAEKVYCDKLGGCIATLNLPYLICEINSAWKTKSFEYKQWLCDLIACIPANAFIKTGEVFTAANEFLKTLVMYECVIHKHISTKE